MQITAGEKKSFLDSFKPLKEGDQERAQKLLDELHEVFKDWVTRQRGDRLKHDKDNDLFTGEFWIGQKGASIYEVQHKNLEGPGILRKTFSSFGCFRVVFLTTKGKKSYYGMYIVAMISQT